MTTGSVSLNNQRLCVTGVITLDNVQDVCALGKSLMPGLPRLAVDLSGVSDADSSCIAMLIEWIRSARDLQQPVEFYNAPPVILRLVEVCGLDQVLPLGSELVWK